MKHYERLLAKALDLCDLTQVDLAHHLGVNRSTVCRWLDQREASRVPGATRDAIARDWLPDAGVKHIAEGLYLAAIDHRAVPTDELAADTVDLRSELASVTADAAKLTLVHVEATSEDSEDGREVGFEEAGRMLREAKALQLRLDAVIASLQGRRLSILHERGVA